MIIITTPTGHIGSKVLEKLIKTNEKLRVLARDPSKLSSEVKSKSEIMQGSLDDSVFVSKAYADAQALFLVIPPTMNCTDVNEYYLNFAKVSCDAIIKRKIKHQQTCSNKCKHNSDGLPFHALFYWTIMKAFIGTILVFAGQLETPQ